MGSATSRSTTPRTAIRLGARSPRRRSSPICFRSNEHTAYGSLGYLFGPNVWLLLYLVLLKWDIPRCERHLFAPWVVPVLGRPWAVGFPSGALPHRLGPVCAPLPLWLAGVSPA